MKRGRPRKGKRGRPPKKRRIHFDDESRRKAEGLLSGVKAKRIEGQKEAPETGGTTEQKKTGGLADLLSAIKREDMGSFSSLYLDPIGKGFKITIWSGKRGIVEGFVAEEKMPSFVREVLVNRTESLTSGESIEVIGKREDDIASIASEPIDAQANGSLEADISEKNGEISLKITLKPEETKPLTPEEAPSEKELNANIERLSELVNRELRRNTKTAEYEKEALKLIRGIEEAKKLKKNPKDKKLISKVYDDSGDLAKLSEKHGFVKIAHLAQSISTLFGTYDERGAADPAAIPIVMETVEMMGKMLSDLSGGHDVDTLVQKISRKDG